MKIKIDAKWRDMAQQVMEFTSEASEIVFTLRSLRNKPTKTDYIAAGMQVANIAMNFIEFEEDERNPLRDFFKESGKDWINLQEETFYGSVIMEFLHEECTIKKLYEDDKDSIDICGVDLEGDDTCHQVIWVERNGLLTQGPYAPEDELDEVFAVLGNFFWKRIGSPHATAVDYKEGYKFIKDDLATDTLPSTLADETAIRIKKYLDHPEVGSYITRALLFYGRAGTGKSTAMRAIAERLKMRSLRISFFQITDELSTTLLPALKILKPDVLLIDDIDRSFEQEYLLEHLEMFRKYSRVILASANYPDQLDMAVLRPGRFDEAVQVDQLDADVIGKLVGDEVPRPLRMKLGAMPIAYINEFSLCRKVLGDDEAFSRIAELHDRIEMGSEPILNKNRKRGKTKKKAETWDIDKLAEEIDDMDMDMDVDTGEMGEMGENDPEGS